MGKITNKLKNLQNLIDYRFGREPTYTVDDEELKKQLKKQINEGED